MGKRKSINCKESLQEYGVPSTGYSRDNGSVYIEIQNQIAQNIQWLRNIYHQNSPDN